jgi:hypothetical protein
MRAGVSQEITCPEVEVLLGNAKCEANSIFSRRLGFYGHIVCPVLDTRCILE